jgi:hypothetical protein
MPAGAAVDQRRKTRFRRGHQQLIPVHFRVPDAVEGHEQAREREAGVNDCGSEVTSLRAGGMLPLQGDQGDTRRVDALEQSLTHWGDHKVPRPDPCIGLFAGFRTPT